MRVFRRLTVFAICLGLALAGGCGRRQSPPPLAPAGAAEHDPYAQAKSLFRTRNLEIVPVQSEALASDGYRGSVVLFATFDVRTSEVMVYPPTSDPVETHVKSVLAPISAAVNPRTATADSLRRWLRLQLRSPGPVNAMKLARGQQQFVMALAVADQAETGRYTLVLPFVAPFHAQRLRTPLALELEVSAHGVTLIAPTGDRTDLSAFR